MALNDGFVDLHAVLLADIGSLTQACELCVRGSGLAPKAVAVALGIGYDHFTRMFREHDSRHFPPDLIVPLMELCKNLLPLEWLAYRMGYALHEKSLAAVLVAIRDALQADGRAPKFLICARGRVIADGGAA